MLLFPAVLAPQLVGRRRVVDLYLNMYRATFDHDICTVELEVTAFLLFLYLVGCMNLEFWIFLHFCFSVDALGIIAGSTRAGLFVLFFAHYFSVEPCWRFLSFLFLFFFFS